MKTYNPLRMFNKIAADYPSAESVINNYSSWKAMCQDININSMEMLEILFTKEEIAQITVALGDNVVSL